MKKATKQAIYDLLAEIYLSHYVTQLHLINLATEKFGEPFNPNTLREHIRQILMQEAKCIYGKMKE